MVVPDSEVIIERCNDPKHWAVFFPHSLSQMGILPKQNVPQGKGKKIVLELFLQ